MGDIYIENIIFYISWPEFSGELTLLFTFFQSLAVLFFDKIDAVLLNLPKWHKQQNDDDINLMYWYLIHHGMSHILFILPYANAYVPSSILPK